MSVRLTKFAEVGMDVHFIAEKGGKNRLYTRFVWESEEDGEEGNAYEEVIGHDQQVEGRPHPGVNRTFQHDDLVAIIESE